MSAIETLLLDRLRNLDELLTQKKWEEAIESCVKILDISLTQVYKKIFHCLKPIFQKKIIDSLSKMNKRFEELTFGQKIVLYKNNELFSQTDEFILTDLSNFDNLFLINDLRVHSTHPTKIPKKYEEITKAHAYYSYSITLEFLSALKMVPKNYGKENIEIFNNLPPYDCIEFIGREHQIKQVLDALSNERFPIVSIHGIGGVGKSTLAIECAQKLSTKGEFDAIIWLTAKREKLTIQGIKDIENTFENLEDLFDAVLNAFNSNEFNNYNFDTKKTKVLDLLENNCALLVVDNLETLKDEKLKNFLINDVPNTTKILITSRERLGQLEKIIMLKEFTREETCQYLTSQLKNRDYDEQIKSNQLEIIQKATGGIPLALKMIIPWIVEGKLSSFTEDGKVFEKSEIMNFCFEKVFNEFLNEDSQRLFLIISTAPADVSEAALRFISELPDSKFIDSINSLKRYSLISTNPNENIITMLPLTQLFGRRLVSEKFKELKTEIHRKYVKFLEITSDDKISANRAISINKAEEAMRNFRAGNEEKAEKAFKEAITYDKTNDYAFYLYAIFSKERQNHGQAVTYIRRAIDIDSQNPGYWMEFSNIYDTWSDFRKSERVLEEGLRRCNHDIRLTQKLVVIKERLNKIEEAINIAEKHIDMNPVDSKGSFLNTLFVIAILEGNWRLGCKFTRKNRETALVYFLDGIKSSDKYQNVIHNTNAKFLHHEKKMLRAIAEIYEDKRDLRKALEYYGRCKYRTAYFADRRRHNSEINYRISKIRQKIAH